MSAYAGIMNQFQADQALQQQIVKILSVDSYQSGLVRSWLFSNGANPIQWFSSLQVFLHLPSLLVCGSAPAHQRVIRCQCDSRTMHATADFFQALVRKGI